jgi:hypothetical protein
MNCSLHERSERERKEMHRKFWKKIIKGNTSLNDAKMILIEENGEVRMGFIWLRVE